MRFVAILPLKNGEILTEKSLCEMVEESREKTR